MSRRRRRHRHVLLVTAGDNPDRICNEAAWAHLCGTAPLDASSGKTRRHRLTMAATNKPTMPYAGS